MEIAACKCGVCGAEFERPAKEVRRCARRGLNTYCGTKCALVATKQNLKRGGNPDALVLARAARWGVPNEFREHLRRARSHSKVRGRECNITEEHLQEVWLQQQGKCAYTGIALLNPTSLTKAEDPGCRASLDRIDSSLGYVIGNVQFISVMMNYAKSSFTDAEVKKFVDAVRKGCYNYS